MAKFEGPQGELPDSDREFVGLEKLEPEADVDEVSPLASAEPEQDSPGDDAVLEQEELMEGLSSAGMPSQSLDRRGERD